MLVIESVCCSALSLIPTRWCGNWKQQWMVC